MGYYVSHMIGIRTGGVFSGGVDEQDVINRIKPIVAELEADISANDPSGCISKELEAHKGSYIVIAGVFNYWKGAKVDEFCRRLSKEFGTDVMHMEWDEQTDESRHSIWLDGEPLHDVNENPISRVLRRVT